MSLCLTCRVNLGLSLRKTAQAMKDIHGIPISHQMVANYCKTAAICIKPFVDTYPYEKGSAFVADETYIKVRGIKGYIWLIINAVTRAVIGYQVSDNRGVGPCIMAMRMAFQHLKELPETYSKYFRENCERIPGRRLSPHTLRHTHTAMLAEAGVPLETISRRLGHSDSEITKSVYLHVTEGMRKKDREQLL